MCNDCNNDEKKLYARKLDKEKVNNRSLKSRRKIQENDPIKYTCIQMRSSASKRSAKINVDFNLTSEYLISIANEYCPILKVKLKYGGGEKCNNSASLDRIDSSLGYTEDNVQIVSALANQMKSNANDDELLMFANWVYEKTQNVAREK